MTCTKAAYAGARVARRVARKMREAHGSPFRAYACPDCGAWHLTTGEDTTAAIHGGHAQPKRRGPRARTAEELEALARAMRER